MRLDRTSGRARAAFYLLYLAGLSAAPARASEQDGGALRADAPLVIVDTEPQKSWRRLDGVPERGGHGIRKADLVREMTAAHAFGEERYPTWIRGRSRGFLMA